MNCAKCGAPVTGSVCPYCGSPTYMTGPQAQAQQDAYEENEWYEVPDSKPDIETSEDTVWYPDTHEDLTVQDQQTEKFEPFYYKSWFVILMLFMFPVIGCAFMWLGKKWSQTARIIITVLVVLSLIGGGGTYANILNSLGLIF
ncbi:MAG: hypothetical protein IJ744_04325 [Lachnospiraceae bacterium]|nr:hypothetical protein [Lachnospiraceae bacterium]